MRRGGEEEDEERGQVIASYVSISFPPGLLPIPEFLSPSATDILRLEHSSNLKSGVEALHVSVINETEFASLPNSIFLTSILFFLSLSLYIFFWASSLFLSPSSAFLSLNSSRGGQIVSVCDSLFHTPPTPLPLPPSH